MSKTKLKKELASMPREQMGELIVQIYDASKEAKAWLDFYLEPDIAAFLEKYKKQIHTKFYGRNGKPRKAKFRDCNKLIATFRNIVQDSYPVCDLMLYFMETAFAVAALHRGYGEAHCRSLAKNFQKTLEFIAMSGLTSDFGPRIDKILRNAAKCGYGLEEEILEYMKES